MTGGSFSASELNISNIEWHSKRPGRRLSVYLRYILGGIQIRWHHSNLALVSIFEI